MTAAGLKSLIAVFLLGILVGAAGLNVLIGNHLDNAELEILRLRSELEDKTQQLDTAEKELKVKKQAAVVDQLDIHVNFKDEYKKLEIESAVKKLLQSIKGQEVRSLDPLLITNIVDGRTVKTENNKYSLTVRGALISEKIIMYVDAKEEKDQVL